MATATSRRDPGNLNLLPTPANVSSNDDGTKTVGGWSGPPLQSQASTISKVTTSILRVNSMQTYGTSQQGRSKKRAIFADPIDSVEGEEIRIKVFNPDEQ